MTPFTLVIGNKNYSSWSLRAWLFLKHAGLEFEEVRIPLDTPDTHAQLARYGPSRRVPVLRQGELCIWDSLAICEYVAELTGTGWPQPAAVRARARAVCAEMHSGFAALRAQWPMNARALDRRTPMTPALQADIERIDQIWSDCRSRSSAAGRWLFGAYSIADAYYAPVVLRFNTYGAELSRTAHGYMSSVLEDRALQEWLQAAREEPWTIAGDETG